MSKQWKKWSCGASGFPAGLVFLHLMVQLCKDPVWICDFTQALLFLLRHTHGRSEWCLLNEPLTRKALAQAPPSLPRELSVAPKACRDNVPSGGFLPSPVVLHDSPCGVSSSNTNCFDHSERKLKLENSWSLPSAFLISARFFLLTLLALEALFLTNYVVSTPGPALGVAPFAPGPWRSRSFSGGI